MTLLKRAIPALLLILLAITPASAVGTLFGLPLSQQIDVNGKPVVGAQLYLYQAGTTTPVSSYANTGLSTLNAWPLVTDSTGRIPQFWLADGTYRARLTTSGGVQIFDLDNVTALGAGGGGTSSSSSVDATTIAQTGDMLWNPIDSTRSGWVRANGRTIGSGASGATERANADTLALYEFLWNNFADALCPVSGGRGANADADFNANKPIQTLDMRGRAPYGLDTMGNSAASKIASATSAAVDLGQETKAIAQGNLPSVNFSVSGLAGSVATTVSNGTLVTRNTQGHFGNNGTGGNANSPYDTTSATVSLQDGTVTFSGSPVAASGGSGTALATLSPGRAGSWFVKL